MRNTWAAYKVDIATGRIEWTLGGKHSSFRFGSGAGFQWQHNVAIYPGTPFVTVFDDHCCQIRPAANMCRRQVRHAASCSSSTRTTHTATLADQYTHGATSTPSTWATSNHSPTATNSSAGARRGVSPSTPPPAGCCSSSPAGPDITYRATVEPWVGLPLYPPSGAARRGAGQRSSTRAGTVPHRWPRGGCWPDRATTPWCPRRPQRKSASRPRSRSGQLPRVPSAGA